MAKFTFLCRQCGEILTAPAEAIGKSGTCFKCGAVFAVPTPQQEAGYREQLRLQKERQAAVARLKAEAEQKRRIEEAEQVRLRKELEGIQREREGQQAEARRQEEQRQRLLAEKEGRAERERSIEEWRVRHPMMQPKAAPKASPASPTFWAGFVEVVSWLMFIAGCLVFFIGLWGVFRSADERSPLGVLAALPFVAGGLAVIWAVAFCFLATSMARNLFCIAQHISGVSASETLPRGLDQRSSE